MLALLRLQKVGPFQVFDVSRVLFHEPFFGFAERKPLTLNIVLALFSFSLCAVNCESYFFHLVDTLCSWVINGGKESVRYLDL